jgi:hypothetical protein
MWRRMVGIYNSEEPETIWKVAAVFSLKYEPCNFLELLRKATTNHSQDNRCSDRDSNRVPPDYKAVALLLEQPAR